MTGTIVFFLSRAVVQFSLHSAVAIALHCASLWVYLCNMNSKLQVELAYAWPSYFVFVLMVLSNVIEAATKTKHLKVFILHWQLGLN